MKIIVTEAENKIQEIKKIIEYWKAADKSGWSLPFCGGSKKKEKLREERLIWANYRDNGKKKEHLWDKLIQVFKAAQLGLCGRNLKMACP